jgi:hypothetical protein
MQIVGKGFCWVLGGKKKKERKKKKKLINKKWFVQWRKWWGDDGHPNYVSFIKMGCVVAEKAQKNGCIWGCVHFRPSQQPPFRTTHPFFHANISKECR